MTKILIIGGPRTGKTTLAEEKADEYYPGEAAIRHCDELKHLPWSEQSDHIAKMWFPLKGPWIIEGTAAVRALRKYVQFGHEDMSDWEIIWVKDAKVELTPGQKGMTTSVATIWKTLEPVCLMRGAKITYV